jgi:hypothetical protein
MRASGSKVTRAAVEIHKCLARDISGNDSLFVAAPSGEAIWKSLSEDKSKWLRAPLATG